MGTMIQAAHEEQSIVFDQLSNFGRRVSVCSVHFMPVREERDYKTKANGGYRTTYYLAAVKDKNSPPSVLTVLDGFQRVFRGTDDYGHRSYSQEPEPAINIARDIVRVATGAGPDDMDSDRPAIWISKAPSLDSPEFQREVEQMRARQFRWCERKIKEAEALASQKQEINIGSLHRNAAVYIGSNPAEHPWMRITSFGASIDCPLCGVKTSRTHPKCQNCKEVIDPVLYELRKDELKAKVAPPLAPPIARPINNLSDSKPEAKLQTTKQ